MSATETSIQRKTYSVEEAADLLGISRSLAYKAARCGQIPVLRVGKRFLIPRLAIEELLKRTATTETRA